ncbi:hypothetical protein JZ751_020903 [Albula glossodonta]|uniref:Uncharacterized protein n=1 Tax=Albula glossodonta TaxID=121402 RepID=A0A8T2PJQ6_9TELE|nr:hypothetical protein JZ751_020903 [Albula glossodonta]
MGLKVQQFPKSVSSITTRQPSTSAFSFFISSQAAYSVPGEEEDGRIINEEDLLTSFNGIFLDLNFSLNHKDSATVYLYDQM